MQNLWPPQASTQQDNIQTSIYQQVTNKKEIYRKLVIFCHLFHSTLHTYSIAKKNCLLVLDKQPYSLHGMNLKYYHINMKSAMVLTSIFHT